MTVFTSTYLCYCVYSMIQHAVISDANFDNVSKMGGYEATYYTFYILGLFVMGN